MSLDGIHWHATAFVKKYDPDQVAWARRHGLDLHEIEPYEIAESGPNLATTAGLTRIASLIVAGGGQGITATSARLGVGDGTGTAGVGDTDLSASAGASHRYFCVMDATYPQASGATITLQSTFTSGNANFEWKEWGIDVGAPTVSSGTTVNALLVNHKTSAALGTKASGYVWALQPVITLS